MSTAEIMDQDDAIVEQNSSLYRYQRPTYFRQTRKGKIIKTVTERYIRQDLGLGSIVINQQPQTLSSTQQLLDLLGPKRKHVAICDANLLIHNMDLVEPISDMIQLVVPQTALQETRHNQRVAYDRAIQLLSSGKAIFLADQHHIETISTTISTTTTTTTTSPNDDNDERIRNAADMYGRHLQHSNIQVLLISDDKASRTIASLNNNCLYQAFSVKQLVQLCHEQYGVQLSDHVAAHSSTNADVGAEHFPHHMDATTLSQQLKQGTLYRGVFRRASDNNQTATMVTIRREDQRVAVEMLTAWDCNRALEGDVVAIQLNPVEQWHKTGGDNDAAATATATATTTTIAEETAIPSLSELENLPEIQLRPTGKVVGIIRRNFPSLVGSIYMSASSSSSERQEIAARYEQDHNDGSSTCIFFPVDGKMPPTLIRTTQRERLWGQRIIVTVDSWPAHSAHPLGHYVRTLGPVGSKDVETDVLLEQHEIPHEPFSTAVLACLPPDDYAIQATPDRMDLRRLPVLSIDPPGCKDIDDALHCISLPNGNYQIGVHIADVTHYVQAGSAMDVEAARRSTSTYLVNQRIDMLPSLLTTDLCSLKGNVDRYAFSVLWEVTKEAEIVNVDFGKSIIHSIGALTYQQAQAMIDLEDSSDAQGSAVRQLASLARLFRKRRIDAGALTLASPEVKFVLDSESLNPTDVQAYALLEANAVVEEFMLLANVTVAKKILRHFPTLSVLRRHPAPNRAMFDELISKARSRGFVLDIEDSKRLADSLDAATDPDPYINKLLRILSTRCMSPAQYFCSGEYRPMEWQHYGLAAPVYTHFTSPIRRYADVCVHRLLAAALHLAPLPQHMSSKSYLHDLCANMNRRKRAAQLAGRASVQLHTLIFFAGDGAKIEEAYVLDVETSESKPPSFTVMVPRYGIEGRVKLDIAADDVKLERFPEEHRLSYGGADIKVFDKVRVRVWVREFEDHQRELVLDLVDPSTRTATDLSEKRTADDTIDLQVAKKARTRA